MLANLGFNLELVKNQLDYLNHSLSMRDYGPSIKNRHIFKAKRKPATREKLDPIA